MESIRTPPFRGSNRLTRGASRRSLALILALALAPALSAQSPPLFSALLGGSGQDFASAVTSDAQGNTYVAGLTYSNDFPVTPGAFQTTFGGTCDAFIAKLGPNGKVIWATYLGGILDDWATGIALDGAGNVLIAGQTRSANFPLANAIQTSLDNNATDDYDAFIAKFDPTGGKLLYSTFLGGNLDDGAAGLAVDSAGNAYAAITSSSASGFPGMQNGPNQFGIFVIKLAPQGALLYSYFHPNGPAGAIAIDATGAVYVAGASTSALPSGANTMFGPPGASHAIVFKLSPDGTHKIYETALGGSVQSSGAAIAVNSAGEAYIAGSTTSVDFPLVHPFQTSPGARPLWKSTDSGATWAPIDDLPFALPQKLIADPANPNTLYEATGDLGVFKSVDAGATWVRANSGIAATNIPAIAINPLHSQTLYAAATNAVYKSTDGAASWTLIDTAPAPVAQLAIDGVNDNIVYEVGANIRVSGDAGASWKQVIFPGTVASMALDPKASGHLFAISNMVFCGFFCANNQPAFLYRSFDGGATWIQIGTASLSQPGVIVDASTMPSTIYEGLVSRSLDGGVTWSAVPPPPFSAPNIIAFAVDPSGNFYVAAYPNGIYLSRDHAQTWAAAGSPTPPSVSPAFSPSVSAIVPDGPAGVVFSTIYQTASSGFISKLSADGSTLEYSTYLRAHASTGPITTYAAEPSAMLNQSWISGIALDAAGNITVAGGARGSDLLTVHAAQPANAGLADGFLATLSADGAKLTYSTYFGRSQDEGALAVSLDPQGNAVFAGQTWSHDFPVTVPFEPPFGFGDAFVVKLATGPPVISAVLNGASFQTGIEAGSWVVIKGSNLADTYPGRTWTGGEIVDGALPTSLDGVSVTIDGKPAFVEYVSPTQINVQAPSDSATGAVNVVVTNNGASSQPASAELRALSPALFLYGATNAVAANLLPDYTPVGDPSIVPGAVPAQPGDTIVLWGTGFGPTTPEIAPGTTVTGAPVLASSLTVTIGGVPVPVVSAVLTPGEAGLYQITVQLPSNIPSGTAAVQASVAGVLTQPGASLFIAKP